MKDMDFEELMEDHEFMKYTTSGPLMDDVRKLYYTDKAKACTVYHQAMKAHKAWKNDEFMQRFEEDYQNIDFNDLAEAPEWIMYCINDMDNSISCIDYNDPSTFFDVALELQKLIEKCEAKSASKELGY